MPVLLTPLLGALLVGGWTFIWLVWSFEADVRAWLAGLLFTPRWRNGKSRGEVAGLSPTLFSQWLIVSSRAPLWLSHVMTCHYCWAAHVAAVGSLLLAVTMDVPWHHVPLTWACGAAIGIFTYGRFKQHQH